MARILQEICNKNSPGGLVAWEALSHTLRTGFLFKPTMAGAYRAANLVDIEISF